MATVHDPHTALTHLIYLPCPSELLACVAVFRNRRSPEFENKAEAEADFALFIDLYGLIAVPATV